jgi:hypothetical protein
MSDALGSLTENQLRKFVGDEAVDRAARHLLTGKVQERLRWSDGDIEAYWDTRLEDIAMHAESRERTVAFDCTCGMLEDNNICEHVLAMLLAWVTDPASFEIALDDEDTGFDSMFYDADLDLPSPAKTVTWEESPQQEYLLLMSGLTVHELRDIARYRGVPIAGNRKEPILEALAEALSRDLNIKEELWQRLTPAARLVAGLLPFVLTSGSYTNRNALWKTAQKWGLNSEDDFHQALDDLKIAGLAFLSSSGTISFPSHLPLALPADAEFTPAFDRMDGAGVQATAGLKTEPTASPQAFVQNMTRLLLILQAGDDRFTANPKQALHPVLQKYSYLQGWPYDLQELIALEKEKNPGQALWTRSFRIAPAPSPLSDETRHSLAALLHIDHALVDFSVRLLEANGLLKIKEGQPLKIDREKTLEWLQLTSYERAGEMLFAYAEMPSWTEFDLAFERRPDFAFRRSPRYSSVVSYKQVLAQLADSRKMLMYQVRRQPAGRWTDFETFLERARHLPNTISAFTTSAPWFFELNGHKLDLARLDDWKAFYGIFVEAVLNGPLRWQGLVEIAYQKKKPAAFRLTEFGAAMLLQSIPYQFPSSGSPLPALEYAPDGSLVLHVESAGGELLKLLGLLGEAHLSSNSAIAYQVSPAGAANAFAAGWSYDRVVSILQEAAGAPLPPELSNSLQKWWRDYGSLQIYEDIALMELADDHALNELLASTSLSRYLLYRFNPRLVAVRPEGIELLREEMVKKGYTPKISGPLDSHAE